MSNRCPTCDSPAPHLHPSMQFEGEVDPCDNEFHQQVTSLNTPAVIAVVGALQREGGKHGGRADESRALLEAGLRAASKLMRGVWQAEDREKYHAAIALLPAPPVEGETK